MFSKTGRKNHNLTQPSRLKIIAVSLMTTALISGCGGGDDGSSSGANSVPYNGNSQPAELDNENASAFTNQTYTGGTSEIFNTLFSQIILSSGSPTIAAETLLNENKYIYRSIIDNKLASSKSARSGLQSAITDINTTENCPDGGSLIISGSFDDITGEGSAAITYNNCRLDPLQISGSLNFTASGYNTEISALTNETLTYNNLHYTSTDPNLNFDFRFGADIRTQLIYTTSLDPFTKRTNVDISVASSSNTNISSFKIEGYVAELVFDRYSSPTSATADVSGRFFHSTHGYVDIDTVTPLQYGSTNIDTFDHEIYGYPLGGGPLIYTGASNKKLRFTPVDSILVNVAADTDGDDFYEFSITLPWSALENDYVNNNAPNANAGADASITIGQTAQLDGGQSTDLDYNLLSYRWVVSDQPVSSNAGLVGSDRINPNLTPDTAGSYTLTLTVNDGLFTDTDTVVITVTP